MVIPGIDFNSKEAKVILPHLRLADEWRSSQRKGKDFNNNNSGNGTRNGQIQQKQLLEEFLKWINSSHPEVFINPLLEIKGNPSFGLSVYAIDNIAGGSILADIPQSCMLCANESLSLMLNLMQEVVKENSWWRPYLNILPQSFPLLPSTWDLALIEGTLKGSNAFDILITDILLMYKQYMMIEEYVIIKTGKVKFPKEKLSWDLFEWARCVVLTRQNQIRTVENGEWKTKLCLVPFYDLFNHKADEIFAQYDSGTNKLELSLPLNTSAASGHEIFMTYGPRCNRDFFIYSGFVIDDLRNDFVNLQLSLSKGECFEKRKHLLEMVGIRLSGIFSISFPLTDVKSSETLQFLTVVNMDEASLDESIDLSVIKNLEEISDECKSSLFEWLKSNFQVKIKVLQLCLDRAMLHLKNHDHIEEDKASLIMKVFQNEMDYLRSFRI